MLERLSKEYVSPCKGFFTLCIFHADQNVSCHRLIPLPTMSKYACCFGTRLIKKRAVLVIFFVV
jgi:hypothetical protein